MRHSPLTCTWWKMAWICGSWPCTALQPSPLDYLSCSQTSQSCTVGFCFVYESDLCGTGQSSLAGAVNRKWSRSSLFRCWLGHSENLHQDHRGLPVVGAHGVSWGQCCVLHCFRQLKAKRNTVRTKTMTNRLGVSCRNIPEYWSRRCQVCWRTWDPKESSWC